MKFGNIYTALSNTGRLEPQEVKAISDEMGHTTHCLEYLRQSTMCAADTTLEPFTPNLGLDGTKHKCRDWDTIYDIATRLRATDKSGILD
jgi:hypothetical protein